MRKKSHKQMPLTANTVEHPRAEELALISDVLAQISTINDMVLQDLTHGDVRRNTGAHGMTAEQVLRAAIIKKIENFSYEDLAFHLMDSLSYRNFCRIGITHKGFKKSALCANIKAIHPETWEKINDLLVVYGKEEEIEKGTQARIDCTVVCSNIHEPSDSKLLYDCVRVITRMLGQFNEQCNEAVISFSDHTRRAKRRMLGITYAKKPKIRNKHYKDLLKVTQDVMKYARNALPMMSSLSFTDIVEDLKAQKTIEDLKEILVLTQGVIDQTTRRVIHGEEVPANEKIVSIFEPHTDIIKKDRRDTFYGHKICLSGGPSNLITDCLIVEGNPADSTLTTEMLDRQGRVYGRYPLKVALDGGFASKDNLMLAKERGIKDVCFAKKRGLKEEDMCRSKAVYKKLRRFRAGIESGISWLKRSFGLSRCTWKSFRSFKSYVWASVVSANLLTLARSQMEATS